MNERLHLFGIRHHGPGSAASLMAALNRLDPAAVLIEGPPEAGELLQFATLPGMKPPVALLIHAAEKPGCASFFPFAAYSPEWGALQWALKRGRPVRMIDWPAAISLAQQLRAAEAASGTADAPADEPAGDERPSDEGDESLAADSHLSADPMDALAEIAGHSDGEAWWNALVESSGSGPEVFAAIESAMTALRQDRESAGIPAALRQREDWREAHMRLAMRDALKEVEGAIAVVVGAWHVPALRRKIAATDDRALIRDLPRVKVEATWVPWTETRLAAASGYGAGVLSPGWYGHLWELYGTQGRWPSGDELSASWQAKVGRMLRREGQMAAPASVIEAARLASALAALRERPLPGLTEMRDATLATLCDGNSTAFSLVETRLIIGDLVGQIDEGVPQMPLAADLARWQRKTRLKPEALEQEIAVDLRSEAGLLKSTLLHRLDLIDVPWGRIVDAQAGRGTFREIWKLAWAPELSVKLAEALIHGPTVEQAAGNAALARAGATDALNVLADIVRHCLLADLPAAAELCIGRLQAAAVNAADIVTLMTAVPPLVAILRYGTARKIPEEALLALAKALAVEVTAGAEAACRNLDDAAAERMRGALDEFDSALGLLEDSHLIDGWNQRLATMTDDANCAPLVAGAALRRLYDRSAHAAAEIEAAMSRALSPSLPPKAIGDWLEGFIGRSAEIILQDRTLFGLLDRWLVQQPEAAFMESLPMLRRAFSGFDSMGRRRLLADVAKTPLGGVAEPAGVAAAAAAAPGFAKALPLLLTILGIKERDHGSGN